MSNKGVPSLLVCSLLSVMLAEHLRAVVSLSLYTARLSKLSQTRTYTKKHTKQCSEGQVRVVVWQNKDAIANHVPVEYFRSKRVHISVKRFLK